MPKSDLPFSAQFTPNQIRFARVLEIIHNHAGNRTEIEQAIADEFFGGNTELSESNSYYLTACRQRNIKPHPARFPAALPEFFIKFLTEPYDLVVDPFGGSNTTGEAAEALQRYWIAFELVPEYLEGSKFRFPELQQAPTLWTGITLERPSEYIIDPKLELIDATEDMTEEDIAPADDQPTIASLRGAADSLNEPLSWHEVEEIAQEDHIIETKD